jgi:hypothetical protein
MSKLVLFLISVALGAAAAWFMDRRRQQSYDVAGGDTVVAPPTEMSGPRGAGRPVDLGASAPSTDNTLVQPTPATAGPLPLVDEAAGGHQVLGGGPAAEPPH